MCQHCAPRAITGRTIATRCAYTWTSITPTTARRTPKRMHSKKRLQGLHREWNAKGSPRVAKCLELHQAMQVYTFSWMSTMSTMCLPCQGVTHRLCRIFFCGLTSAPLTSFLLPPFLFGPALLCQVSDLFHSQAILRRLHRGCAHVCVCPCLYACVSLLPSLPY